MEDIQFLKNHCIEEFYLLHIDGRDRDKTIWPTPGEFRIDFAEPFPNE